MRDLFRYKRIAALLLLLSLTGSCKKTPAPEKIKIESGSALGTTYTIKYEAVTDTVEITTALHTIFKEVNRSMSTYLPDSDITRINNGDTTIVTDAYFKAVYTKAKEVWQHSNGSFDPTVGALVNAWGFGPENALKEITPKQVDSLLQFTGFEKVSLTPDGRILKEHPALYLDFNALAKGYTIDLIGEMLTKKGITNYLIELGGELLAHGVNPQTAREWTIAIDDPLQKENNRTFIARLHLKDKALATSGNYRKFKIDETTGARYMHIIDPQTGYPKKSKVVSVSVVAPTCMEADAYATAFMVMEPEETKELLKTHPQLQAYILSVDTKDSLVAYTTEGFKKLMATMQ